MEEIKDRCISKKEYLERYDSYVGYALYVQDNIKKDDYARLNTGEIVKVIGIKENNVNKKAIYYGMYETDWFDSLAVENFSDNIIDLIEIGDYVNHCYVLHTAEEIPREQVNGKNRKCIAINTDRDINNKFGWKLLDLEIREILTKEQYMQNCYKLD